MATCDADGCFTLENLRVRVGQKASVRKMVVTSSNFVIHKKVFMIRTV